MDGSDENPGGTGGSMQPLLRIREIRMRLRAVRQDFPLTQENRALIVSQMLDVVRLSGKDRDKIMAAKVLVTADGNNIKREAMDLADLHHCEGQQVQHTHTQLSEAERDERKLSILREWFPNEPIVLESSNGHHPTGTNGSSG